MPTHFLLVIATLQSARSLSTLFLPFTPCTTMKSSMSLVDEHMKPKAPSTTPQLQTASHRRREKRQSAKRERYERYRQSIVCPSSFATETNISEMAAFYICTLCYFPLPRNSIPYTIPAANRDCSKNGGDGRVFCEDCWVWIYNLAICWACGEIVGREEGSIGFGWCWWHWGCLNCMSCRVSYSHSCLAQRSV